MKMTLSQAMIWLTPVFHVGKALDDVWKQAGPQPLAADGSIVAPGFSLSEMSQAHPYDRRSRCARTRCGFAPTKQSTRRRFGPCLQ